MLAEPSPVVGEKGSLAAGPAHNSRQPSAAGVIALLSRLTGNAAGQPGVSPCFDGHRDAILAFPSIWGIRRPVNH